MLSPGSTIRVDSRSLYLLIALSGIVHIVAPTSFIRVFKIIFGVRHKGNAVIATKIRTLAVRRAVK